MILTPENECEIADAVRAARADGRKFRIIGGGTKQTVGRPIAPGVQLSLGRLSGVTLYEPAELTLSAKAGTPLSAVEAAIAHHGQMLAFEPPDWRALLGQEDLGPPTVGAAIASGLSGSRRVLRGAARDGAIGLRFVNGFGEIVKSGGRVVKNVAGLDLVKAQTGAWGALGVVTEATFKLTPKPQSQATLVLHGLDDGQALAKLAKILASPFEISGAAHTPEGFDAQGALTMARVENFAASVDYRLQEMQKLIGFGDILREADSAALWRKISDCRYFAGLSGAVWRLSIAPSRTKNLVEAIKDCISKYFYDWGGGLIWILAPETEDSGQAIRAAAQKLNGHAMLIRAPERLRQKFGLMQPLSPGLARLNRAVKSAFDPDNLFNPCLIHDDF